MVEDAVASAEEELDVLAVVTVQNEKGDLRYCSSHSINLTSGAQMNQFNAIVTACLHESNPYLFTYLFPRFLGPLRLIRRARIVSLVLSMIAVVVGRKFLTGFHTSLT